MNKAKQPDDMTDMVEGSASALAYLYDHIFEALPEAERKYWPEQHLEATPVGADLSGVMDRFRAWMLRDLLSIPDLAPDVYAAVEGMAVLFERRIAGDEPTEAEWDKAAWAARDVRDARVAWAARDAWAAWVARDARAAWVARDASVAGDAWGTRARDTLLKLLSEAPQAVSA